MVDGRPSVMYYDRLDSKLYYIAANDPEGRRWGFPMAIPYDKAVEFSVLFDQTQPMKSFQVTEMGGAPVLVSFVTLPGGNHRLDYVTYY